MKKKLFIALTSLLIFAIGATSIGLIGWYLALKIKGGDPTNEIHTHEYTVQSVTEPTCTGKGYSAFVCECGKTRVGEYKDALGHDLGADNICTRCGFFQHEHEYEKTVTAPTCTEGGYTRGDCKYCTAGFIAERTDPLGHDFVNGKCTRCNYDKNSTDGMEYTLSDDGGYYILSGIGTATVTEVFIPQTYNGKPVKEIGASAFKYNEEIRRVTIPDSITYIGNSAFDNCISLTEITIPDSVTSTGDHVFSGCSALTDVKLGNGLKNIGGNAFSNCVSLTSIIIPDSVITIGESAFSACTNLSDIKIGSGVTAIGLAAFRECGIKSITVPDSVTVINDYAFYGCAKLESITIPGGVTNFNSYTFSSCPLLTSITFKGTMEQWQSIRGTSWFYLATACTVHCTDGDLTIRKR